MVTNNNTLFIKKSQEKIFQIKDISAGCVANATASKLLTVKLEDMIIDLVKELELERKTSDLRKSSSLYITWEQDNIIIDIQNDESNLFDILNHLCNKWPEDCLILVKQFTSSNEVGHV